MKSDELDALIDSAMIEGQLSAGINPQLVAARSGFSGRAIAVLGVRSGSAKRCKSPKWTNAEDDFLIRYLGILTDAEIAEALGRSEIGVHLRWSRDLRLPAPSKRPDYLTGEQIAAGLGMCGKSIARLIDRGLIEGHRLPCPRVIRVVHRFALLRFLTNPLNFIYFKPERIGQGRIRSHNRHDPAFWDYVRRLVLKRRAIWGDEWWRIGAVAKYRNLSISAINKAIRTGKLPAVDHGNWWVLKSEAVSAGKLQAWEGKGGKGQMHLDIPEEAVAFMILCVAVGQCHDDIEAQINWSGKRADYLMRRLHRDGQLAGIIRRSRFPIAYDALSGEVAADWRMVRDRLPRYAAKIDRLMIKSDSPSERIRRNRASRKAELFAYLAARRVAA